MPDPDVPPIVITKEMIDAVKMPEDLFELRERLVKSYGIDAETSRTLTLDQELVRIFEKFAKINATFVADWLRKDLKGELNYRKMTAGEAQLDLVQLEKLIQSAASEKIPRLKAKDMLRDYLDKKKTIDESLSEETVVDIDSSIDEAIRENPDVVEKYKSGKTQVINALIGAVSAKVKKAADANIIRKKLVEKLG
jgi:aspartyl-tRNA(Asn)/glutamyl-tRNA(Gln) amidotransferase subunit B